MDFIARLVALVPKPRVNLTRFHGVFAPNSVHRAQVTPAKRGKGNKARTADAPEDTTPAGRSRHPASRGISASMHVNAGPPCPVFAPAKPAYMPSMAITWAQRLKRVFNIDIESCNSCGGPVKIIACIEDPLVIKKVLTHLDSQIASEAARRLPPCRAPPHDCMQEVRPHGRGR